jgi:hypothetical protein
MTKYPKQKDRNTKPRKIALHDAEQASSRAIQPKGANGLMTSAILFGIS